MTEKKLTTFYIVRHGETDWNNKKVVQGHTDIPLNKTGQNQAKEIAKKFKDIKFDLAFSSDLLRTKHTAEIILLERKLVVETTKVLRERYFGSLEGKHVSVLHSHMQLLRQLNKEARVKHKIAGEVESDDEFSSRILTFLRETAVSYPGKTIFVSAHGGTIRQLLIHLGELTYEQSDIITVINTGYIKLETDGVDFFVKEKAGIKKRKEIPESV